MSVAIIGVKPQLTHLGSQHSGRSKRLPSIPGRTQKLLSHTSSSSLSLGHSNIQVVSWPQKGFY